MTQSPLIPLALKLRRELDRLSFNAPVACTYNPLDYAWQPHRIYLERYGAAPKRVVFLGMNPGPFGMVQTGVPFGEITAVRDWLKISAPVGRPSPEHPKRPVTGFACARFEVSGQRFWRLFASRFGEPDAFFQEHLVLNYCPLVWMSASGANLTPDKLNPADRAKIDGPCRKHLRRALLALRPVHAVGIGKYAGKQLAEVTRPGDPWTVSTILHPSPANPAANRGWADIVTKTLVENGVWSN